ncbi:hypothetical protein CXG81DRAFT_28702 [Caulochytrium protostelioides]|uniref:Ribosomal RNA-processing protein 14/surfeit locus protein 6 C-terminal domain-containing protein n=1 Tax=Caulochytrium protostelioides TaxID=1555241 RepID=A0A4P9X291_9FUNG|nr:hypothetical protein CAUPRSCDRAFT_13233 [Caulochytrium protostelioides]RKO98470.1 hypothetical protein CXG81DRAFT_28702 [Caulochytrium protostelioides]|eukprot:RKO98470.1 hypothetical protein CXG81DRAFT_28702 [Caulochytrium protostelioides]
MGQPTVVAAAAAAAPSLPAKGGRRAAKMQAQQDQLELVARLASHESFFDELISLIPVTMYRPVDEDEDNAATYRANAFTKNRKNAAPKQAIKEASVKAKKRAPAPSDAVDETAAAPAAAAASGAAATAATPAAVRPSVEMKAATPAASAPRAASLSDLQARLTARIQTLRAQRGVHTDEDPLSREAILTKRNAKLAKGEDAYKKRKRLAQDAATTAKFSGGAASSGAAAAKAAGTAKMDAASPAPASSPAPAAAAAGAKRKGPSADDLNFNRVEHASTAKAVTTIGRGLEDATALAVHEKPKNLNETLQAALSKQKAMEALKAKDPALYEETKKADAFAKAMARTQGVKIRDDIAHLKKKQKQKQKQKQQSQTFWNERKATQEQETSDRVAKRNEALEERRKGKKTKGKK